MANTLLPLQTNMESSKTHWVCACRGAPHAFAALHVRSSCEPDAGAVPGGGCCLESPERATPLLGAADLREGRSARLGGTSSRVHPTGVGFTVRRVSSPRRNRGLELFGAAQSFGAGVWTSGDVVLCLVYWDINGQLQ